MGKKYSNTLLVLIALFLLNNYNLCSASPFGDDDAVSVSVSEYESIAENDSKANIEVQTEDEAEDKVNDNKGNLLEKLGELGKKLTKKAYSVKKELNTIGTAVANKLPGRKGYLNESIFLPGHETKEMVCQGIAYLPSKVMEANEQGDGSYCQYVLLSYYPKNSEQSSQIVVIDRETAMPVRRLSLYKSEDEPYTGHAGGIAVAGKYLWVASGNKIYGFNVQTILDFIDASTTMEVKTAEGLPQSLGRLANEKLVCEKTYAVDSKASYISFDGKYLWVGDFTKKSEKSYKPIAHHNLFKRNCWVAGYLVDSDGCPTSTTTYTYEADGKSYKANKPDAVIAMRESVQGMAVCGDYIALTISYGAVNSKLAFYKNPLKENGEKLSYKPAGQSKEFSVEAWELADKKNWVNTVTLAAGAEDLEYDGENLYVTFECSSKNYKDKWKLNPLVTITDNFYLINPEKAANK